MFKKIIQVLMGQPEGYVSPADRLLAELRKKNPKKSPAQLAEIAKYDEVRRLRDGTSADLKPNTLWRDF